MKKQPTKVLRRRAEKLGRLAEALAVSWLRVRGYQIRETRYRNPAGEIDLIVARGKFLVFVEVKWRANGATPYDVSSFQADRLVRTASLYLAQNPIPANIETRFDLILMGRWRWPRHICGAFFDDGWGGQSIT